MVITMEDIAVLAAIGILILAFVLLAVRENARQRKNFQAAIRRLWGQPPEGEWSADDLESISHYTAKRSGGRFLIDDITWNDLDLDGIFLQINSTVSSCGEDYLYSLLRLPEFDEAVLKDRDRLITFFETHVKEREQVQMLLRLIGKRKRYSVSEYLDALEAVPVKSIRKYVCMALAGVISIALFFVHPLAAVALFLLTMIINGITHYRESQEIEKSLACLSCVLRILKAADALGKCSIPELESCSSQIRKNATSLQGIRKKCVTLVSAKGGDTGLTMIFSYLNNFFLLDFIQFYSVLRQLKEKKPEVEALQEQFGILDSAIAIASFRAWLPFSCKPEFPTEGPLRLEGENLYHPLIAEPVANTIRAEGGVLLTGSNASGKSTFLKTVALNAILAQSIYTCTATRYRCRMVKTMTSMALRDNVSGGESYYIVEIKSLQRILKEIEKGDPVFCIIDEVLRGTNTIERIAASSRILASLRKKEVLAFAATHDIELTYILDGIYDNYHFEEEITDHDICFSYLLKPDRAASRNAISLLEFIGYDKKLVADARAAAAEFEQEGVWKPLTPDGLASLKPSDHLNEKEERPCW